MCFFKKKKIVEEKTEAEKLKDQMMAKAKANSFLYDSAKLIKSLENDRKKYIDDAADAKLEGNEDLYISVKNAAIKTNNKITMLKKAKLFIEQQTKEQDINANLVKVFSQFPSINSEVDFDKFAESMIKMNQMAENNKSIDNTLTLFMDTFNKSNSSEQEEQFDAAIDAMINERVHDKNRIQQLEKGVNDKLE